VGSHLVDDELPLADYDAIFGRDGRDWSGKIDGMEIPLAQDYVLSQQDRRDCAVIRFRTRGRNSIIAAEDACR
jgi:hypothetical protein